MTERERELLDAYMKTRAQLLMWKREHWEEGYDYIGVIKLVREFEEETNRVAGGR